ncbi:P-loop NTPase family protein [Pseudomonas aeruginosa]
MDHQHPRVTPADAQNPSAQLLARIKREASLLKKDTGIKHAQSLDRVAKSAGFSNFADAQRKCSAAPPQPKLTLPVNFTDMRHISIHDVMAARQQTLLDLESRYAAAKQALGPDAAGNALVELEVSKPELLSALGVVKEGELGQESLDQLALAGIQAIADHFKAHLGRISFRVRVQGELSAFVSEGRIGVVHNGPIPVFPEVNYTEDELEGLRDYFERPRENAERCYASLEHLPRVTGNSNVMMTMDDLSAFMGLSKVDLDDPIEVGIFHNAVDRILDLIRERGAPKGITMVDLPERSPDYGRKRSARRN